MTRHEADYVARQIGKSTNWVRRNARRYPHSRAGRSYFWTDQDVADLLAALRVRPGAPVGGVEDLRPIPARPRRVSA